MKNYKKNQTYRELMEDLKLAVEKEFYYEAIFIEYAIFEDRTESLIRHSKIEHNLSDKEFTLHNKIKVMKYSSEFKSFYCNKHEILKILIDVDNWRDKRNKLIHDLVNTELTYEDIKEIAIKGYELVNKLNNKSTLVNDYFDNKKTS